MNFRSCGSGPLLYAIKALPNLIVSPGLVRELKLGDLQMEKSMRSWKPPLLSRDRLSMQRKCS